MSNAVNAPAIGRGLLSLFFSLKSYGNIYFCIVKFKVN